MWISMSDWPLITMGVGLLARHARSRSVTPLRRATPSDGLSPRHRLDVDLDAPVRLPAGFRGVLGHRLAFALAGRGEAHGVDFLRLQVARHRKGAALGEPL